MFRFLVVRGGPHSLDTYFRFLDVILLCGSLSGCSGSKPFGHSGLKTRRDILRFQGLVHISFVAFFHLAHAGLVIGLVEGKRVAALDSLDAVVLSGSPGEVKVIEITGKNCKVQRPFGQ